MTGQYTLREHEILPNVNYCKIFDGMRLVEWKRPMDNSPLGYYASYIIGAEWTKNKDYSIVVMPKNGMENIDFVSMFYYCFSTSLDAREFAKIYTISLDQPPIEIKGANFPVGLLTIMHFLSVVSRIRCLKKEYKMRTENLKKIRGHVDILKNDRINISQHRYHKIYCKYNDYDVNIPENRIIKKALLFSQKYLKQFRFSGKSSVLADALYVKCKTKFADVSPNVNIDQIKETRYHKLFKEYSDALRLAKMILKQYDYNIRNVSVNDSKVIPFTIDMSLLYEHYVYGLLHEAYKEKIKYQFKCKTGFPDFLYCSSGFKAILDTKYIPRFESDNVDKYIIRQLSGYGRDKAVLKELGVQLIDSAPPVPCIIIYPSEGQKITNPFKNVGLKSLMNKEEDGIVKFYKIEVPLPTIQKSKV